MLRDVRAGEHQPAGRPEAGRVDEIDAVGGRGQPGAARPGVANPVVVAPVDQLALGIEGAQRARHVPSVGRIEPGVVPAEADHQRLAVDLAVGVQPVQPRADADRDAVCGDAAGEHQQLDRGSRVGAGGLPGRGR